MIRFRHNWLGLRPEVHHLGVFIEHHLWKVFYGRWEVSHVQVVLD